MNPNHPTGPAQHSSGQPNQIGQGGPAAGSSVGAGHALPSTAVPASAAPSKIQHSKQNLGPLTRPGPAEDSTKAATRMPDDGRPLPVAESTGPLSGAGKITAFGKERRHEDTWARTPNTNGTGAIHVKTFHCKLTEDAISYMDQTINEWLDAHPQYEVKFVSSTVGLMTGKLKEPALFCQVWV